jgi:fructose-specific component phosphotransferase system IIB-like protein
MEVNLPDFAHLVTVFGSTLNNDATSAGVNKTSCSEFNLVAPH